MMPTAAEIEKVKTNLTNMQAFNDYQYTHGNPLIANAYALLSETNTDKGMGVIINLMQSAFWAMAAVEAGPVGAVAANTLCGILDFWTKGSAPEDMAQTFADLIQRFEAASIDVDRQLAVYHSDPAAYWDTQFSYNGQSCTVGDLATIDFPTESDPEFFTLMDPCLFALDGFIWKFIITTSGNYIIAKWQPGSDPSESFDFNGWQNSFYAAHPSYWATAVYHPDSGSCGDDNHYVLTQYNLSTGAGIYHDGHIPDAACNYLFADRAPGQTYPECSRGLFPRTDVFTTWGLTVKTINLPTYGAVEPDKGWFRYVRAKAEGKAVLSDLHDGIGVEGLKTRILEAVKADPSLRIGLQTHPRETMEQILGVVVPDFMAFTFIVEGPRRYGLVIPWEE